MISVESEESSFENHIFVKITSTLNDPKMTLNSTWAKFPKICSPSNPQVANFTPLFYDFALPSQETHTKKFDWKTNCFKNHIFRNIVSLPNNPKWLWTRQGQRSRCPIQVLQEETLWSLNFQIKNWGFFYFPICTMVNLKFCWKKNFKWQT